MNRIASLFLLVWLLSACGSTKEYQYTTDVREARQNYRLILQRTDDDGNVIGVMPMFQGKNHFSAREAILKNIRWRPQNTDIEGVVYTSFTISKEGTVKNIIIHQTPHHDLGVAVYQAIESTRGWTPAYDLEGNPVEASFNVPFDFSWSQPPHRTKPAL